MPKWRDDNLNILIPMAGAGSRFAKAGYVLPKPLIIVKDGKSMIELVIDNINIDAHYIFVVQRSHYDQFNLESIFTRLTSSHDVIQIDGITEGAACTTLLAKSIIDCDKQLLIINSDQLLVWDSADFMKSMYGDISGGIMTLLSYDNSCKWSYAAVDNDIVIEVREKVPFSNHVTCGVYYWKHGNEYVRYAEQMIAGNKRVNGEFYVCPVYNEMISDGGIIKNYLIQRFIGLGTPEDLESYVRGE